MSLLSKSTQKGLFPAGHYVQIPYGKRLQAFSSNFGSVCVPQKAWLCFWSPGEAGRGISHEFGSVHLGWVMDAVPADRWCVGRRVYCQPKYRCTALLLQPAWDRHPRKKEIRRGLWSDPEGWYFFPFPKGSYVLSSHIISLRSTLTQGHWAAGPGQAQ